MNKNATATGRRRVTITISRVNQSNANMGWFASNTDKIDNKGQLQTTNNTIVVKESVEIHNDIIIVLLFIITIILVIRFVREVCAIQKRRAMERSRHRNMITALMTIRTLT